MTLHKAMKYILVSAFVFSFGLAFQNCAKKNSDSAAGDNTNKSSITDVSNVEGKDSSLIPIWHGSSFTYSNHLYTRNKQELTNNPDYNPQDKQNVPIYIAFYLYSIEPDVKEQVLPVFRCLAYVNQKPHHHFLSNDEKCESDPGNSAYTAVNEGALGYLYKNVLNVPSGKKIFTLVRCFYSKDQVNFHMASINPSVECGDPGFKKDNSEVQKDGAILGYYAE